MDISTELKQRFCTDCQIPIDIFTEPIFASRIELYDRFYNTIERYNIFLKMIQERYTTYEMESKARVTGFRKGTCDIIAKGASDPFVQDFCQVKVKDDTNYNVVDSVYIDTDSLYLSMGAKRNVEAHVVPETVDNIKIAWSTSDKRVATVAGGVIVGIGLGECTITAISDKDKSKTATCVVKVTEPVQIESVNFIYHETQLEIGHSEKLSLNSLPLEATDPDLNWVSSNSNVASVDAHGVVTGKTKGSCSITASSKHDPSIKDTCYVLVDNFVRVTKIVFDKNEMQMIVGGTAKIAYEIEPEKASNVEVSWYSTDTSILTVDANTGIITAVGRGSASIKAVSKADNSRSAECVISVVPSLNVRNVELDIHDEEIDVEQNFELTCRISVGYDVNPGVNWYSSNERIAGVEAIDSEPVLVSTEIHAHDYYNDYDEVKCKLVTQIKTSSGYAKFNAVDTERAWPISCNCQRSTIYTPNMDGHTMIGVTIEKSLFTPLYHYDPTIFRNLSAWENFVSTVGETDNDHIIYSENLLEETMNCCNRSRIETYGQYILGNFYNSYVKPLVDAIGKGNDGKALVELVYFSTNEFVLDVTKLASVVDLDPSEAVLYTNRMIKLYQDICRNTAGYECPHSSSPNRQPFPMRTRLFTLYKIKTEYTPEEGDVVISGDNIDGYVENIYYEGNQPLEFIDVDPCQLPMLMRSMSYESLQEHDRKFMHRGLIAEFTDDYKIYVPPISTIPDTPKVQ